jgi:hypothetical protein
VTNGRDAAVDPAGSPDAGSGTPTTAGAVFRVPALGATDEQRLRERRGDIPGVFARRLDVPAHTLHVAQRLQDCAPIVAPLVALGPPLHPVGGARRPAARAGLVACATDATAPERPRPRRASSTARWSGRLVAVMSRLAAGSGKRVR